MKETGINLYAFLLFFIKCEVITDRWKLSEYFWAF
jgi:hypothetical protein